MRSALSNGAGMGETIRKTVANVKRHPPNILVVEDDPVSNFLVSRFLGQYGFNVFHVSDAAEAIELLQSDRVFDLVFSDVIMSGPMDGLGLARWIVLNHPGLPIVLGSADKTFKIPLALGDEVSFFAKPYNVKNVAGHIQKLLAR